MSVLRGLWADLIDKRLWPVALVLAAGLVAVPLLLLHSEPPTPTAAPTPAAAASPTGATGVATPPDGLRSPELATAFVDGRPVTSTHHRLLGPTHDPFRPLGGTSRAGSSSGGSSTSGSTPSPGSSSGSPAPFSGSAPPLSTTPPPTGTPAPPTGGSPSPSSSSPITPVSPAQARRPVHHKPASHKPGSHPTVISHTVVLRLGPRGRPGGVRELSRLQVEVAGSTVLNGRPLLVYLGALSGPRRAVFLLSSMLHRSGPGACRPLGGGCELLILHPGQSEILSADLPDGRVAQAQLDVLAIHTHHVRPPGPVPAARQRQIDSVRAHRTPLAQLVVHHRRTGFLTLRGRAATTAVVRTAVAAEPGAAATPFWAFAAPPPAPSSASPAAPAP